MSESPLLDHILSIHDDPVTKDGPGWTPERIRTAIETFARIYGYTPSDVPPNFFPKHKDKFAQVIDKETA